VAKTNGHAIFFCLKCPPRDSRQYIATSEINTWNLISKQCRDTVPLPRSRFSLCFSRHRDAAQKRHRISTDASLEKLLTTLAHTLESNQLATASDKSDARSGIAAKLAMATVLAPVDSREVVRCDRCSLVQFRTNNGICRRCHLSLDEEPEPIAPVQPIAPAPAAPASGLNVAATIRALRQKSGMSQRQLAMRMNVPRTYVSKIENEKATPTLSSLERLAAALQVSVPDLLGSAQTVNPVRELMSDEFIAELVPYLKKLNAVQWQSVMTQVRELSTHVRRTA
jgi:transcriptional regulator with XRE-family HTH domain